jgi:hypothetical protein
MSWRSVSIRFLPEENAPARVELRALSSESANCDSDVFADAFDDVQKALRIEFTPSFDAAAKRTHAKKSKKLLAFLRDVFKYFPRWRMRQPPECIE